MQSGILPLTFALIAIFALRPLGWLWASLGLSLAFFVAVYFIAGYQVMPLTSTRKIIMLGFAATIIGLALDALPITRRSVLWLLGIFGATAVLWVLWPLLTRKTGSEFWLLALSSAAYVIWLTTMIERQRRATPSAIYAGILAISIGTGISAVFGASAQLGQLGGAMAAATGAYILFGLAGRNIPTGISLAFPAALIGALIGISGTVYATLPWFSLIPVAIIPALLALPLPAGFSNQKKLLLMCAITMAAAMVAIGISWQIAGAPPI